VPKGYRVALSVRGRDYVYPGGSGGALQYEERITGNGPFYTTTALSAVAIWCKTTIHLGGRIIFCCCRSFRRASPPSKAKKKASRPAGRAAREATVGDA
jgi:hypothetical protein